MSERLSRFVFDEQGQDLTEYTLIMAFIMLIVVGLAMGIGNSVVGITTVSNAELAKANAAAASGNPIF